MPFPNRTQQAIYEFAGAIRVDIPFHGIPVNPTFKQQHREDFSVTLRGEWLGEGQAGRDMKDVVLPTVVPIFLTPNYCQWTVDGAIGK
jgi:hypothetical protein